MRTILGKTIIALLNEPCSSALGGSFFGPDESETSKFSDVLPDFLGLVGLEGCGLAALEGGVELRAIDEPLVADIMMLQLGEQLQYQPLSSSVVICNGGELVAMVVAVVVLVMVMMVVVRVAEAVALAAIVDGNGSSSRNNRRLQQPELLDDDGDDDDDA